jgi:hypothetical protein
VGVDDFSSEQGYILPIEQQRLSCSLGYVRSVDIETQSRRRPRGNYSMNTSYLRA